MNDRPNTGRAADVDQALAMLPVLGVRAAAVYLKQRGAGLALIGRVLLEPARRRAAVVVVDPESLASRPPPA